MTTDDRPDEQIDTFETRLRSGLDRIAATTPVHDTDRFDPNRVPFLVYPSTHPRRFAPMVLAAAVVVVTVAGLVLLASGDHRPARSTAPLTPDIPAPAFRFETPTVRLEADTVEVITPAGSFVPTADVIVDGDPGMPDEYTTLELTWGDDVEQRIHLYFASDGATWWATEIRTYDGTSRGEWLSPDHLGRFFETPLGSAYAGDLDLPNLRIQGMTLQAFLPPHACQAPTTAIALIADYPAIRGSTAGGFGASFQIYDTATCSPLPIADYTFEYNLADPGIAIITDNGLTEPVEPDPTITTAPHASAPSDPSSRRDFDDIKARVGLSFTGPGSTTLHVTARDRAGTIIGTVTIPVTVTVTNADTPAATTAADKPPSL